MYLKVYLMFRIQKILVIYSKVLFVLNMFATLLGVAFVYCALHIVYEFLV